MRILAASNKLARGPIITNGPVRFSQILDIFAVVFGNYTATGFLKTFDEK